MISETAISLIGFFGTACCGHLLGHLKYKSIGLGAVGVLLVGLLFSYSGLHIEKSVIEVFRDFGLILFIFPLGLQLGPTLGVTRQRDGLLLNFLAGSVVLLGVGLAAALWYFLLPVEHLSAAVGLLTGATTNTPSLATAQEIQKNLDLSSLELTPIAYAIAYPFGVIGILLTLIIIKWLFHIDIDKERKEIEGSTAAKLVTKSIIVENPGLQGKQIKFIPTLKETGVVISRLLRDGKVQIATPQIEIKLHDILLAVGLEEAVDQLAVIVGGYSSVDVRNTSSEIVATKIVVSKRELTGIPLRELGILEKLGVKITRIIRNELQLTALPHTRLQLGDQLTAVGSSHSLEELTKDLGGSYKQLDRPLVASLFLGLTLGMVLGLIPIPIPWLPSPVYIGAAGGPLLVAILLGRIGKIGPFSFFLPPGASYLLRETGISLFLAAVGLKNGETFFQALGQHGLLWLSLGATITLLPILIVGIFARAVHKLNYLKICGLLAGSMTDPPALSFALSMTNSDLPSSTYSMVYPLTMFMRIMSVQILLILLAASVH